MRPSIRAEDVFVDPEEVVYWVDATNQWQFFSVATLTILVYDSLITMDKEIKFFWRIPRSTVDVVYFLNRYIAIFGAAVSLFWNSYGVTEAECNLSSWMLSNYIWLNVILMDYILTIRVIALYSQERMVSIYLWVLFWLDAFSTCFVVIYLNVGAPSAVAVLGKDVTTCTFDENAEPLPFGYELALASWIVPLVYGTILMILGVYKAVGIWKMSAGFKGVSLLKVVVEDQMIYFAFYIWCITFNLLQQLNVVTDYPWSSIVATLGDTTFLCVLGSRMLYNVKEAAERRQITGTECGSLTDPGGDMEFAGLRDKSSVARGDIVVPLGDTEEDEDEPALEYEQPIANQSRDLLLA